LLVGVLIWFASGKSKVQFCIFRILKRHAIDA
jgi:hypothetical protein